MALDLTVLNADVAELVGDLPTNVTFGAQVVEGSRATLDRQEVLVDEGLRGLFRFSVYTQKSDWSPAPKEGETVVIDSVTYRVLKTSEDAPLQILRLDLGEQFGVE